MENKKTDGESSNSKKHEECQKEKKKAVAKAYDQYAKQFTPKPRYISNCVRAFLVGGFICTIALAFSKTLMSLGVSKDDATTWVSVSLVMIAQLLTGIGIFDTIARYAGAGVIVPITGFANSMVSPALEYKREGWVLGVGSKLFSVAGPVLVCGISTATVVGIIYWIIELF